jgi:lipoyl-dependent peroxiredoxin
MLAHASSKFVKEKEMERKASAVWKGGLKDGKGEFSVPSGVFSHVPYSFSTRFENAPGTNPEELIAAAHASCFSMALSAQLGAANLTPESINTTANLKMEKQEAGWAITSIHLDVSARVPKADDAAFQKAAESAKAGCPVSKVLNAQITMAAKLER